eukprot:COSAG04_NODE_5117_length_1731_cov_1.189951_3_plen_344_part_01
MVVDASALVTDLPVEMSGAGCGIEYLNHEINGGLYSQMVSDESFENLHNASTGLTTQWRAGGCCAALVAAGRHAPTLPAALNGHQFLRLECDQGAGATWAENRGTNRWGINWKQGRPYEGSLWAASSVAGPARLRVAMTCGASNTTHGRTLAEQNLSIPSGSAWAEHKLTLTPAGNCATAAEGGLIVQLLSAAAGSVSVDMVSLHPGAWGLYHGLPTRKDLATFLIERMRPAVLRMGGGSINARMLGDDNASNASGWGLGYTWRQQRGPRHLRQPFALVNPNIKQVTRQVSISSAVSCHDIAAIWVAFFLKMAAISLLTGVGDVRLPGRVPGGQCHCRDHRQRE